MVKHVKLFENWAEENVELPWYLDPSKKDEVLGTAGNKSYNIWNAKVQKKIQNINCDINAATQLHTNFKSLSDYDFWLPNYTVLIVNQKNCKYKLEDWSGIPECQTLEVYNTNIKTLRGLEKRKFDKLLVNYSKTENLKYCPESNIFDFSYSPLLSYYGIKSNDIESFAWNLCGDLCYEMEGYHGFNVPSLNKLKDIQFNADIFCHFKNKDMNAGRFSNDIQLNPWTRIHDDPNEVENFDFLFVPFYLNSENFRTKAKEFIKNLDITNLDRSDLW